MYTYHLCKTVINHGDYEYTNRFLVYVPEGDLPDNVDHILTAWEFDLLVKDVEKDWDDEVWSDVRRVRTYVQCPTDIVDAARHTPYIHSFNWTWIRDTVEYGDERDQEVA
jgi:hypothetical protein